MAKSIITVSDNPGAPEHAEVNIKWQGEKSAIMIDCSFEELVDLQYSITSYMAGPRLDG